MLRPDNKYTYLPGVDAIAVLDEQNSVIMYVLVDISESMADAMSRVSGITRALNAAVEQV